METAFLSKPSSWLIIALVVLLSFKFLEKPPKPEIVQIPGETIIEQVIQYETAPLTEAQLDVLLQERFDTEFQAIREQLAEHNMQLAAIVRTQASGQGERIIERVVTVTEEGECIITPIEEELALSFDDVQVPVAEVELNNAGELRAETYDLELQLDQVIGETERGSITAIGRLNAIVNGNTYELPITGEATYNLDRTVGKPEQRRFRIWDPQISLNVGPIFSTDPVVAMGTNLGFSVMSYGYEHLERFRFLELGFGTRFASFDPYASIAPLSYNIGEPLPLVDDVWLTPSLGLSLTNQSWLVGLGLGTTF